VVFWVWLPQLLSSDGVVPEPSPPLPPTLLELTMVPATLRMGVFEPPLLKEPPLAEPEPPPEPLLAPPWAGAPPPMLTGPPTAEQPTNNPASENVKTTSRHNMNDIYHRRCKVRVLPNGKCVLRCF
jgi:hypothetical protein